MTENSIILLCAGLGIGLWLWTTRAREAVDALSRKVCQELNLQRLDDAVALRSIRLRRRAGHLTIERVFGFEFSRSGAERCQGEVCLQGSHPQWIHLAHPDGGIHIELPA